MGRPTVARKAAQAYYGFSEKPNAFPRGTRVEVHRKGDVKVRESMFLSALAADIEKRWNEFVGMQSRTARISNFDMAYLINKLNEKRGNKKRVKPEGAEVLQAMAFVADHDSRVVLVRVERESDDATRALLVNTEVTL